MADDDDDHHQQPISNTHLNLLTYNFFLRPPFISDYKGDYKEERLTAFIDKVISKYDIIALQETFIRFSNRASRLIKQAEIKGMYAHHIGPKPNLMDGQVLDSGLLVLSRWPIVHSKNLSYSKGMTVDKLACKGVSYTHHIHPTRRNLHLHLFNTHLQASYNTHPTLTDSTVMCRRTQILELVTFIQSSVDTTNSSTEVDPYHVILVCGDLNVNSLQEPHSEYLDIMTLLKCGEKYAVTDLLATDKNQDYTQLPWVYFSKYYVENNHQPPSADLYGKLGSRLDYIFLLDPNPKVNSHLTRTRIDRCEVNHDLFSQLSDHMGVACELTLPVQSEPNPLNHNDDDDDDEVTK